ncbi:hypothetical protein CYMTET_9404 [Cymbomonas tetramitiformis]|uniref:RRM domain-containing protein n=1 Tax=Cymbomonas tetramitiformis TaxID=36881 RepID=A0AAE0GRI8_9CHLO|nr:hypothetical protein CYMTET_9404 [Cymbomonas tetramitiformis]
MPTLLRASPTHRPVFFHCSDERDDMDGVGSFERPSKTLYVQLGGATCADASKNLHALVSSEFGEWGALENVNIIHAKGLAFVRYAYRAAAEFAKEAMAGQTLRGGTEQVEPLTVKWAFDDPNPAAIRRMKREREEQFSEAVRQHQHTLPPAAHLAQAHMQELTSAAGMKSNKYPNTDAQYPNTRRAVPGHRRTVPNTDAQYPNTDAQYRTPALVPNTGAQYPNTDAQYPNVEAHSSQGCYPSQVPSFKVAGGPGIQREDFMQARASMQSTNQSAQSQMPDGAADTHEYDADDPYYSIADPDDTPEQPSSPSAGGNALNLLSGYGDSDDTSDDENAA